MMLANVLKLQAQAARRAVPVVTTARRFAQQDAVKNAASGNANAVSATAAAQQQQQQQPPQQNATGSTTGSTDTDDEAPKYKPGFFSRNPGLVFGSIVLGIALYVYRSSRSKKNFEATQLPIADAAVISPYEAWELRSANEITPETFDAVREGIFNAFTSGKAAMAQFDRYLGYKLAEPCPQGLHKAYHLERVLMSLEKDAKQECDVDALMVAFSMAVKGAVDERLQCLFNLAARAASSSPSTAEEEEKTITQPELERLIELLLMTYQVPSEKRVLPVKGVKYPFQEYKSATPHDLLEVAVQAQVDAKLITSEEANARTHYTFEAFSKIMTGKTVCLWGECFANSKKKMKN